MLSCLISQRFQTLPSSKKILGGGNKQKKLEKAWEMYRGIRNNIITIGLSIKKVSIETRKYIYIYFFFVFYSMKDIGGVSISTSICRYNITRRR